MTKAFKITSITLSLIILLFVASIILVVNIVDPNAFKTQISDIVQKKTGREFAIHGHIGWSVFPWLGVKLEQIELGNAKGFGKQPFAKIKELDIRIKMIPLLFKQIEVGNLILKGLNLNLIQNPQGKTNWDDLTQPTEKPKAQKAKPTETAESAQLPTNFKISSIKIANSQITWYDQKSKQKWELNNFTFNSSHISENRDFPIEISTNIKRNKPVLSSKFHLTSKIRIVPKKPGQLHIKKTQGKFEQYSFKRINLYH